jgi:hypothetical protein
LHLCPDRLPDQSIVEEELDIQFIENKDSIINSNLYYILNNCSLEIKLDKYSFLFHGYFKTDPLNSLFKENLFNKKFTKLNIDRKKAK